MKSLIIVLCGEKRLHTGNLKVQLNGIAKAVLHFRKGDLYLLPGIQGRADGSKKVGIFRYNGVLVIQLQGADKGLFQF